LLLNVLSGQSTADLRQASWQRHVALVGAACAAAARLGEPPAVAAALLPPLATLASGGGATAEAATSSGEAAVLETTSCDPWAAFGLLQLTITLAEAAAAAEQPLESPAAVAERVPRLMLGLLASAAKAENQPAQGSGGGGGFSADVVLSVCLRLVMAQPQLLPSLLAAIPASMVTPSQQAADAASGAPLLPAALQLLQGLLQEQRLRAALLDQRPAMHAALAACRTASGEAGGETEAARGWQERVQRLEAQCHAVST
jgi:hypothetical protein